MKRKTIAVFFGGCSSEYKVSLTSAAAVIQNLDSDKYTPIMVGISRDGDWFHYTGDVKKIKDDTWLNPADCTSALLSPNRSHHSLLLLKEDAIEEIPIDIAFPILHGKNGEDGTIQGLTALAGIPLAGCGVLASALCMDKDRAHKLVHLAGIAVPRSFVTDTYKNTAPILTFAKEAGYPLFVKPVRAGSSYGITKVRKEEDLLRAVRFAFQYDDQVLIEEAIEGFEVGCAVMGNDTLTVGEVDEIELAGGFFDFKEKYTLETSSIHVPARIDPKKAEEVKLTAKKIYKTLGCTGFARVDMFLTPGGEIYFNEVNTIPGFTEHSRYPKMMNAAGISFTEMLSEILALAAENVGF